MVGEDRYPAWIDGLQAASASAREIDDDIQSRPQLPIVYYWPGPLDALFPSTYLYNLFSGNQITKQVYLKRYSPRSSLRTPPEGVQRGAHVLVLPLHIGPGYDRLTQPRPSDTPVLDLYPSFGHLLEDP